MTLFEIKLARAKDAWASIPQFRRGEWQQEVGHGNTQLGYWDWVEQMHEQNNMDSRVEQDTDLVLRQLSIHARDYAGDPRRGEQRGFAALHDLMDANMLLPQQEEHESMDGWLLHMNRVIALVTKLLIQEWEHTHHGNA